MKNPKTLKLIAAVLTGIIVLIIGINIFLSLNSKNDKSLQLNADNSSETPIAYEETEQKSAPPESNLRNNSDELITSSQTVMTKPAARKTLAAPIQPTSSKSQIKAFESSVIEASESSAIVASESSAIEASKINEQIFSEITDNIIKPAIDSFNGEIDIYFEILDHDLVFATRKEPMYPASLAKLFLMGTIFQAIEDEIIEYNDNIANELQIMITISDNAAFNRLFYFLQNTVPEKNMFDFVDDFCKQNNFTQTTIHNLIVITGYEYFIYPTDYVFETSAEDVGHFMSMVYQGKLVNPEASQKMYELLSGQERTWKIPALLPDKAITANKTGEKESFSHDAAIIKSPNCDYVLTIMTDSPDTYQANLLMQDLSLKIYNYLNP
ncbi:MAG: serine hydrolase [Saccharofermentanales bacterium]